MSSLISLNEIVEINPRTPKRMMTNFNQKVSFVPMASVSEDGFISADDERPLKDVMKGYTYFQEGDVLLAKITPCFENGKAALVSGLPNNIGFGSTEFHVLRPGKDVDAKYLFYQLWNPVFRFVGEKNMTGTAGQKRVPVDFLRRYKIPLPPLPEQKRIAAILDKADAIRRKRQQAVKLADEFLRATFLDMFGDPVTNPKGWSVRRLGDLLSFLTSGSRGWAKYYSETGAKFLRIQNVGQNRLLEADMAHVDAPASAESRRTAVRHGDVLLSITADLGRTAVVPKDFGSGHINQHLCILRPRTQDVAPCYLSQFLSSEGGQRQIDSKNRSAVKAGLNFDDIRSLEVVLPPLDRQTVFARFHVRWKRWVDKQSVGFSGEASELFDALSQKAFQGEL